MDEKYDFAVLLNKSDLVVLYQALLMLPHDTALDDKKIKLIERFEKILKEE